MDAHTTSDPLFRERLGLQDRLAGSIAHKSRRFGFPSTMGEIKPIGACKLSQSIQIYRSRTIFRFRTREHSMSAWCTSDKTPAFSRHARPLKHRKRARTRFSGAMNGKVQEDTLEPQLTRDHSHMAGSLLCCCCCLSFLPPLVICGEGPEECEKRLKLFAIIMSFCVVLVFSECDATCAYQNEKVALLKPFEIA